MSESESECARLSGRAQTGRGRTLSFESPRRHNRFTLFPQNVARSGRCSILSMYRVGRQCGAVRLVSRVLQTVERMGCVARRICKAGAHGLKRDGQTCIAVTERVDRTQSINWIEQARRHGPLVTNLPLDVTLSRAHACRQASLPFPLRSLLPSSRHPSITSARAQANTCLSPHRGCL